MLTSIYTAVSGFLATLGGYVDAFGTWLSGYGQYFVAFCEKFCYRPLHFVFEPINRGLAHIYQPWATIIAIAYFLGTMAWVCFYLREPYVNEGRSTKVWYTDLRLWTVISMLPHVFVYIYFY